MVGVLKSLFFLSQVIFINFVSFMTISSNDLQGYFCNYTSSTTYQTNRDSLLSSLSTHTNESGYYSSSYGVNPYTVYAMVLCRADVAISALDTCRECIKNATAKLMSCPDGTAPTGWPEYDRNDMEGIVWYDYCMVRYSRKAMEGIMAVDPRIFAWSVAENATSVEPFKDAVRKLLNVLRVRAMEGGNIRKVATGNAPGPDNLNVYALTQCTPDLSKQNCGDCLQDAIDDIPHCCGFGPVGGRVIKPSCNFRYEINRFFQEIPGEGNNDTTGESKNNTRTIIIIVASVSVSAFAIVIIASFSIIIIRKKNQAKPSYVEVTDESGDGISAAESLQYKFETVSAATDNFSDTNKLGQGGFGAVYKGRFSNGREIAVKRLAKGSAQGDSEFRNEVILMAKLQHRNLVRLLGFCLEGTERILIYEFVPNSSLDNFLFDFGMARLFAVDETQALTSKIVGTRGYMALEYMTQGQLSVKSDVFSYGVLVLEILSGHRNNSFPTEDLNLISYAWKSWREGTASNLIDPTLRANSGSMSEMMRCIHIGLLCIQKNVAERPTMGSVVVMLSSSSMSLSVPSEPGFFLNAVNSNGPTENGDSSGVNESTQSVNEASITELDPR